MEKAHGRLKPAPREEHSNVKGKKMVCPDCGAIEVVKGAVFAETKCKCGGFMTEVAVESAKLHGMA